MLNVEARVAEWRRLYGVLDIAQSRLQRARAGCCTCGRSTAEHEMEVQRLQRESEHALHAVDAALAATRPPMRPPDRPAAAQTCSRR
jgi:hypothetical protein